MGEPLAPIKMDRDVMRFVASALRSAVRDADGDTPPEWFRFGFLDEVAEMLERSADALFPLASSSSPRPEEERR